MDQIVNEYDATNQCHYTPRQLAMLRIQLLENKSIITKTTATSSINDSTDGGDGLAALFVDSLREKVVNFINNVGTIIDDKHSNKNIITNDNNTTNSAFMQSFYHLRRILTIYLRWVQIDITFSEEVSRSGAHPLLIQLLHLQSHLSMNDNNDITSEYSDSSIMDCIEEIQDIAGEIAVNSKPYFPNTNGIHPFTNLELQQRLPLMFTCTSQKATQKAILSLHNNNENAVFTTMIDTSVDWRHTVVCTDDDMTTSILIHQISDRQSAQADVGFVMWPSAVVLSSLIINGLLGLVVSSTQDSISVLEIGAGCGLSGLVTAYALKKRHHQTKVPVNVIMSDFNTLVLENIQRNIDLNDLADVCSKVGLDFYQQSGASTNWIDMNGINHDPVDIIIGADIICQPSDAVAVANTLYDALKVNGVAYIVCADSKHRFGVDQLQIECNRLGLISSIAHILSERQESLHERADDNNNHTIVKKNNPIIYLSSEDIHNLEQTTGFVCGMQMTLFVIKKP